FHSTTGSAGRPVNQPGDERPCLTDPHDEWPGREFGEESPDAMKQCGAGKKIGGNVAPRQVTRNKGPVHWPVLFAASLLAFGARLRGISDIGVGGVFSKARIAGLNLSSGTLTDSATRPWYA